MNAARDNVPILLAAGRTPLTETGHEASRNRLDPLGPGDVRPGRHGRANSSNGITSCAPASRSRLIVDRALDIAMSEPRGPVYLTLPREVLSRSRGGAAPRHAIGRSAPGRGAVAGRDRGSGGADREGGVPADPDLLGWADRRRLWPRLRHSPRISRCRWCSRSARRQPADRSSDVSRLRRRAISASADVVRCSTAPVPWIPRNRHAGVRRQGDPASDPIRCSRRYPFREFEADLLVTGDDPRRACRCCARRCAAG